MKTQFKAISEIQDVLEVIRNRLQERFQDDMKCLIIYGSWAKGTAKEGSDIDMLALFDRMDADNMRHVHEIERAVEKERSLTPLAASMEDFHKEKIPLYTAIKREGKIILGKANLTISPEPPQSKYAEYFEKSREFETKKVQMAEDILKEHPSYGTADLCFVASKHAVQMALAMKGMGYSSKMAVLLPLTERHFGEGIARVFKRLFGLYVKSEYGIEFLSEEEAKLAIEYAKEILMACYQISSKRNGF